MLELLFIVFAVFLMLLVKQAWFAILMFFVLLIIVAPGMYSMLYGAPFIPTDSKRRKIIMKMGDFQSSDSVYELGCGDGRIIQEVADRGVKSAIGYEFSLPTYFLARMNKFLLRRKGSIRFRNFWKQDYSRADVLICFLLEYTMLDFEKRIWPGLKDGTKVISNRFKMKSVRPDSVEEGVYLYIKK